MVRAGAIGMLKQRGTVIAALHGFDILHRHNRLDAPRIQQRALKTSA
jgi:hypothetical protein